MNKWIKANNFFVAVITLLCLMIFTCEAFASSTHYYYIYDNAGKLTSVFNDSGELIINEYDQSGNIRNKKVDKENITFVDELNDWSKTYSHSANMQLDDTSPTLFEGEAVRASRGTNTLEEVVWKQAGLKTFQAVGYHDPNYTMVHPEIQTSMDGVNWKTESPVITPVPSAGWPKYLYTISNTSGVNFVKLRWMPSSVNWNLQVSKVIMNYDPNVQMMVDDLNDWSKTYSHSANMQLDDTSPTLFEGEAVRASRGTNTLEEVVWKQAGLKTFQAVGYHDPNYTMVHPEIQTSMDGVNWKTESPVITTISSTGWPKYLYTISNTSGVNFVKLRWMPSSVNWNFQVSKIIMNYDPNVR